MVPALPPSTTGHSANDGKDAPRKAGTQQPSKSTTRVTKTKKPMRWTAATDRKLMLLALGRTIDSTEYRHISKLFVEDPTPREVHARLVKLREMQGDELERLDMEGVQTRINPLLERDGGGDDKDEEVVVMEKVVKETIIEKTVEKSSPPKDQGTQTELNAPHPHKQILWMAI